MANNMQKDWMSREACGANAGSRLREEPRSVDVCSAVATRVQAEAKLGRFASTRGTCLSSSSPRFTQIRNHHSQRRLASSPI